MTDKVQKIKEWISKEQEDLMDAQGNFEYPEHERAYHILCNLDAYIDSLQQEPVSEELEEAIEQYCVKHGYISIVDGYYTLQEQVSDIARHFANWQKQQMMKGSIDGEIRFGTIKVQKEDIKEAVKNLREGDKVKLIVIKNNRV